MAVQPTVRARGANARMVMGFEPTPGGNPTAFFQAPFSRSNLGEEQGLIEDDTLGLGREAQDPTPDVINNVGDIIVPVDVRNLGLWLRLFLGLPVTSSTGAAKTHVFRSGAVTLPSALIEVGSPDIGSFARHYGARGNQLQIQLQRSGLLNATLGLMAIGERDPANATIAADATVLASQRFAQATGSVKRAGNALGSVVSASLSFTNNLEGVDTITGDGRIEDSDAGVFRASGSLTVKHTGDQYAQLSRDRTPIDLAFGWTFGTYSLIFSLPRIFLPRVKRPIEGPGGIQAQYNWQASGATGNTLIATLVNDVASYA